MSGQPDPPLTFEQAQERVLDALYEYTKAHAAAEDWFRRWRLRNPKEAAADEGITCPNP